MSKINEKAFVRYKAINKALQNNTALLIDKQSQLIDARSDKAEVLGIEELIELCNDAYLENGIDGSVKRSWLYKDLEFLKYNLKSIKKYCQGYHKNIVLLEKLKSASIRRIAQSLLIRVHPNIFSSITKRPRFQRSKAKPCVNASVVFNACRCETIGDQAKLNRKTDHAEATLQHIASGNIALLQRTLG